MKKKDDREAWVRADIAKKSSALHRVVKIIYGPDAETRQIFYIGRDRAKARTAYHSALCKQNETISNEIVFDAGTDNFKDDAVIPTFSVKWSAR